MTQLVRSPAAAVQVSADAALSLVTGLMTVVVAPALLAFAAKAVAAPALWASPAILLVPELALLAVMAVAAVMAVLLLPTTLNGGTEGRFERIQRQTSWFMVALMAGAIQVIYALMFHSVNCG